MRPSRLPWPIAPSISAVNLIIGATAACLAAVLVGSLLMSTGCSRKKSLLETYCPNIPRELIRHLETSDDSTLAAYGRDVGIQVLRQAHYEVRFSILDVPRDELDRYIDELDRYRLRLADVVASEYHWKGLRARSDFEIQLSLDQRIERLEMQLERNRLLRGHDLTVDEKIEFARAQRNQYEAMGDGEAVATLTKALGSLYAEKGPDGRYITHLRAAIAGFRECDSKHLLCQSLGELGAWYAGQGDVDSMIVCYEEAKTIANECRFPDQAPRIQAFYASYYEHGGRLARAQDALNEAMRLCREYKGGYIEIRYVVRAIHFYARLGCWDVVERLLDRVNVLERQYPERFTELFRVFLLRARVAEARLAMARGEVARGRALFAFVMTWAQDISYYAEYPQVLYYEAEGLADNGRYDDAIPVIDKGIARAREKHLRHLEARFSLLQAQAHCELGELSAADRAIAEFDSIAAEFDSMDQDMVRRHALCGLIELKRGNDAGAHTALENAFGQALHLASITSPGAEGYLSAGRTPVLRRLMRAETAHDPLLAYGAELTWFDMYPALGSQDRDGAQIPRRTGDMFADFKNKGRDAVRRVTDAGAIHVLYAVEDPVIVRWTVTSGTARADTLGTSAKALRAIVSRVWTALSKNGREHQRLEPETQNDLRVLGRTLLPSEIRNGTATPNVLLVTADNFIGRVPFEAFCIGSGERYEPLLASVDVAYWRPLGGTGGSRSTAVVQAAARSGESNTPRGREWGGTSALILAHAATSESLRRAYPFERKLDGVVMEATAVAEREPGATLLIGESATKHELQARWQDASLIYLAAHTLRDPQVPFLVLIPLAQDSSDPSEGFVDLADIRRAHFERCRLAVLSGCSTGAPYTNGITMGPTLGDAFLDSGAAAVVQTFWDVHDDDARQQMSAFMSKRRNGRSALHDLCEVRRAMIAGSHPAVWASYYIEVATP